MFDSNQFFSGGAAEAAFYPKTIDQSLRFEDGDSAYLSRTPSSDGDRTTWTWSGWVKRGNFDTHQTLFSSCSSATNGTFIRINEDNQLQLRHLDGGTASFSRNTVALLRDPSAWYHFVVAYDSNETLATDRIKMWINGTQITEFAAGDNTPPSTKASDFNLSGRNNLLGTIATTSAFFDGYMAEVHFLNGIAATPDAFGETKNGVWVAKTYEGDYDSAAQVTAGNLNGFYLDFQDDTEVEAFNTVLYRGNGAIQSITGMGFQPDLVWIKCRSNSYHPMLTDSVRGAGTRLSSSQTAAESADANAVDSFDSDGFTVDSGSSINANNEKFVAWGWKAGDSNVSNNVGSIPSTVRANDTYGFSIVSYSGDSSASSDAGHGLSTAPSMVIVKNRDSASNWPVYHSSLSAGQGLHLNSTEAAFTISSGTGGGGLGTPTSDGITFISGTSNLNQVNTTGQDYIAYCWAEKTGYSKFGSYTGNGLADGPRIYTTDDGTSTGNGGFKPAFLLIKDANSGTSQWLIMDGTRDTSNPITKKLAPNLPDAENSTSVGNDTQNTVNFLADGFKLTTSNGNSNLLNGNFIYAAFADTREAAFWLDQSGNDNDWQPVNLDHNDTLLDSPTDNFATWNPLDNELTLSDGNLVATNTTENHYGVKSTIQLPSTGKYYFEGTIKTLGGACCLGTASGDPSLNQTGTRYLLVNSGGTTQRYTDNSFINVTGLPTPAVGTVMQVAYDADNEYLWIGMNNVWMDGSGGVTGNPAAGTNPTFTSVSNTFFATNQYTSAITANFGQQPFKYDPPAQELDMAYLPLSTANLPDPAIDPAQDVEPRDYFETFLYTGNGGGLQVGDVIKKPADTITINNSLLFNDDDAAYLSKTDFGTSTDTAKRTFSTWIKSCDQSYTTYDHIIGAGASSVDGFGFSSEGKLEVLRGGTEVDTGTQDIRDTSSWYHVMLTWDSTAGEWYMYINGVLDATGVASGALSKIGQSGQTNTIMKRSNAAQYIHGYLAETVFLDGYIGSVTDFGEFDANGIWIPKDISTAGLTYGTNGFYLNYADSSDLGKDVSGQGNHWTSNNLDSTSQSTDTPTNPSMTLNGARKPAAMTLSEGNLKFGGNTTSWCTTTVPFMPKTGKWYAEMYNIYSATSIRTAVGVTPPGYVETHHLGQSPNNSWVYFDNGVVMLNSVTQDTWTSYSGANTAYIGVALDLDNYQVSFYRNGVLQGTIDLDRNEEWLIGCSTYGNTSLGLWNFGLDTFYGTDGAGTLPTGFSSLVYSNIPTDDQNLENPDFVWIKSRTQARHHGLFDSVRGEGIYIQSSNTDGDGTSEGGVIDFNTNGFTITNDNNINFNEAGEDEVAWCWKTGTPFSYSGETGTIDSVGSVNTESGFSIVTYTGSSVVNEERVKHGLSSAPEMILVKNRSEGNNWAVYHKDLTTNYFLELNSTGAQQAGSNPRFLSGDYGTSTPTSTYFYVRNYSGSTTNDNGDDYVAYCFHSVDGFSKLGSYTGNGNADGPFVYTGFRPAFILIKSSTVAGSAWYIFDEKRNIYNPLTFDIYANYTNVESGSSSGRLDMLSNGFKMRSTSADTNSNGATMIYMAFAENPFKYSNAR